MDPTKPYTSPQICQSIRRTQSKDPFIFTKVHELEPPATSKHQHSLLKEIHLGDPSKNSCLSPGDLRGSCVSSPFLGVFSFNEGPVVSTIFWMFHPEHLGVLIQSDDLRILFQMGGEKKHQLSKNMYQLYPPPEANSNSSPLKSDRDPKGNDRFPTIQRLQGGLCHVSFREGICEKMDGIYSSTLLLFKWLFMTLGTI